MSSLLDPTLLLTQFNLPPQDIELLSFCKSNKLAKVEQWVHDLKVTQINATSSLIYNAIPEINHLKTDIKTRFALLDLFWQPIHQSCEGLARDFLQQPLILPENAQKAALVSQSMQRHLMDGYTLCARDIVAQKRIRQPQMEMLHNSIYRSLVAIGWFMLRNNQLYTGIPATMWQRTHALYQVAEYYELLDKPILPTRLSFSSVRTIREAYTRLLGFASIRPNQLSQNDIAQVYRAFSQWAKVIELHPSATEDSNNLYLVNLAEDSGPIAKSRFESENLDRVLELDFQNLVSQLSKMHSDTREYMENSPSSSSSGMDISETLLDHILNCWSNSKHRYQDRRHAEIEAQACVGLIDCHFHICGDTDFNQFINPSPEGEPEDENFLSGSFNSLVNSMSGVKEIDKGTRQKETIFPITIQNLSNGGYCLLWQGELPAKVEAGELLGIREKGRRVWSLGVVRWIRQLKTGSQLGVQLLTNQPVPYGAAVSNDLGEYSSYMRALHIMASAVPEYSQTLLTGSAPFQENYRAKIKQDDVEVEVRLRKCVFSTSKLKLFSFETLSAHDDD